MLQQLPALHAPLPLTLSSALLKLLAVNTCYSLPEGFCCGSLLGLKAGQVSSSEKLMLLKAALNKLQKGNSWWINTLASSMTIWNNSKARSTLPSMIPRWG